MIDRVSVVRFKAFDGTLHETETGVKSYEAYHENQRKIEAVNAVIGSDLFNLFRQNKFWDLLDDWDRENLIKRVNEIVTEKAVRIAKAVQS